ncbi:MAG: RNA-binding cell elongation regulator Jag/EloR [Oscillospiraceae bacterium]|jgi:spoIIIJ-associated protein
MKQTFVGKTVEEAKEMAAKAFEADISAISFEILEEPKKSIFGKLKGEAKLTASYELTKPQRACGYLKQIVSAMGYGGIMTEINEEENGAVINIVGDKCEELIGRRGEIIDSLQYLASLVCNKGDREFIRISLDTAGYRAKRKAQLENLAAKMAKTVLKTGRTAALEPMNPYERRIVHSVISDTEGVVSVSKGDEPFRKVLISPVNKTPRFKKDGEKRDFPRKDNKNNNIRRSREPKPLKAFDMKTSFEKEYKKPKPEDDLKTGLYSKIEF